MTLWKRLQELLNAQAHYAIDQAEQPEVMLAQLMRDLDAGIRAARSAVVQAVAGQQRLEAEVQTLTAEARRSGEHAEQALAAEDEDGARAALERQVQIEDQLSDLKPQAAQAAASAERLHQQLGALRHRREDYARRRAMLVARQRTARAQMSIARATPPDCDMESAAERMSALERRVADAEALTAAEMTVAAREHGPEEALIASQTRHAVNERMAALKDKLAKP
ncbi:MAG: PspA/IM30 family protein [Pseudomonadota bacterium]